MTRHCPYIVTAAFMVLSVVLFFKFVDRAVLQASERIARNKRVRFRNAQIRCLTRKGLPYEEFLEKVLQSKTIHKQFDGLQQDLASWPNDISAIFRQILIDYLHHFSGKIIRCERIHVLHKKNEACFSTTDYTEKQMHPGYHYAYFMLVIVIGMIPYADYATMSCWLLSN
ncbi:unnamed protein product [Gongylonema pulchrum]|uniref:DUF4220 domain-containing protein n=1 Tax=Gongylonema pulchrum TaxID=637853 RepID=A0A183D509_9BILA|nr:unnamed protein product [Gongylonema pulchrum]